MVMSLAPFFAHPVYVWNDFYLSRKIAVFNDLYSLDLLFSSFSNFLRFCNQ